MKSRKLSSIIAGAVIATVAIINVSLAYSADKKNHIKIPIGGRQVLCMCSAAFLNNQCLSSNNGHTCAPTGATCCQMYNSNCGGTSTEC